MSPQTPENQGWSHQTCSLAPGSPCLPRAVSGSSSTAFTPAGHCPSSCRFLQASNPNLHLWFPLPRPAVPSMGAGASSQALFLQVLLPLPSFIPPQAPSPSSLPWNSRKSHSNLSGLTSQPPAPTSSLRKSLREGSSSSGPASPHAQHVLPREQEPHSCFWGWTPRGMELKEDPWCF